MQYCFEAYVQFRPFNSPCAKFKSKGVWHNDAEPNDIERCQRSKQRDNVLCRSLFMFLSLYVHVTFRRRQWTCISTVFAKQVARVYRNT